MKNKGVILAPVPSTYLGILDLITHPSIQLYSVHAHILLLLLIIPNKYTC